MYEKNAIYLDTDGKSAIPQPGDPACAARTGTTMAFPHNRSMATARRGLAVQATGGYRRRAELNNTREFAPQRAERADGVQDTVPPTA